MNAALVPPREHQVKRCLLVEDSVPDGSAISHALVVRGYEVTWVIGLITLSDGEAIGISSDYDELVIRPGDYCIALVDHDLFNRGRQKITGCDVIRWLSASNPFPVCAISSTDGANELLVNAGAITKCLKSNVVNCLDALIGVLEGTVQQ